MEQLKKEDFRYEVNLKPNFGYHCVIFYKDKPIDSWGTCPDCYSKRVRRNPGPEIAKMVKDHIDRCIFANKLFGNLVNSDN